ncbi:MAG TPA: TldD/PmbA family protein [Actinomycetota bacterium]|nr:TldD/PmbA family protein [Actinomycetota bacterium]
MLDDSLIRKVLSKATPPGAAFAELFVEERTSNVYALEDSRVEDVNSGRELGAGVRVVVGNRASYAYTNVLSEAALLETAEAARAGSAAAETSPAVDLRRLEGPVTSVVQRPPDEIDAEEKVGALRRADEAARLAGDKVRQVLVSYADVRQRILVAGTDGRFAEDDRTRVRLAVRVVAAEGGEIATGFEAPGHSGGFELLDRHTPEEVAGEAARKALMMLTARPSPAGEFPVVLAPGTGGVLIHEACGHGLEADTLAKNASVYAGKHGDRFGSDKVTIVDDATQVGSWGSFGIDDEGTPAQRTVLFHEGILVGHINDLKSAARLGAEATGNGRRQSYAHLPIVRMTNTDLVAGNDDPKEIVASIKRGVYAASFAGGEVNPATGKFVFGMAEAYMIENGKVTFPIKGATLIGDGPGVLAAIEAVGPDFERNEGVCGKDGQHAPVTNGMSTVLLSRITVGGTET